ncbi:MAG: class I SAM-dependent methyltransferase [Dehalococcoidia bacterium]
MLPLPQRYRELFDAGFQERLRPYLSEGCYVLDVGSGRRPAIPPEERPADCYYVGLDVDGAELELAPLGSYAETWTADITQPLPPELVGRFDIVLSFQAVEHVSAVDSAIAHMGDALRPGGLLVFQTSGAFGVLPALVNRVVPRRLALGLLARLTGRDPATVFPAVYDRCWASALESDLRSWDSPQVTPLFFGGFYLLSAPYLLWPYLAWEELTKRARWKNLATHYLVSAIRPGSVADGSRGHGS